MTVDLRQLDVVGLKAAAYDLIAQLERTQQGLQMINAEIARRETERQQRPQEPAPETAEAA